MSVTPADLYRGVYRIRRVEETIAALYPSDVIRSPCHLSIGQEAVSVGVCAALRPTDKAFGSYRSHALYLAKGGDLKAMLAELYGKATGCCGGWGGSMHLSDPDAGVMATSAVVASTIPLAVGHAYALKLRGEDAVVAAFFGDGAMEEGVFHESLNFAALHQLRVLFVLEDNDLAIHIHRRERQAFAALDLVSAYGFPALKSVPMAGQDPEKVWRDVGFVQTCGLGPWWVQFQTVRRMEHVGPGTDWHLGYRQEEPWDDPVQVTAARVEEARRLAIQAEVEEEIQAAIRFAEDSPWPTS